MSGPVGRRAVLAGAVGAAIAAASRPARAEGDGLPPVIFVSHGAPMLLGDPSRIEALRAWGKRLSRPRGILAMTPHYGRRRLELGTVGRGHAMLDLPGWIRRQLPRGLTYATPPNDALAARVDAVLGGVRRAGRRPGFDHTTWMPLTGLFPAADIPVLELSYPFTPEADQLALGRRLAPLREEGILLFASGGMTHNLASFPFGGEGKPVAVPPWARAFDAWAATAIERLDAEALVDWRRRAPQSDLAHPDEGGHFRVMLVAMGFALGGARPPRHVTFPVTGFEATLSNRCVQLSG